MSCWKKYNVKILGAFSDIEQINLVWLIVLVKFLIITYLLSLCAEFLIFYDFQELRIFYDISFYAFLLLIYVISYKAISQPYIFSVLNKSEIFDEKDTVNTGLDRKPGSKYVKSKLDSQTIQKILRKLKDFMKESQPFLDSNLTIDKVSKMIDIPKHHLSQALNAGLNKNFYTFVNEYRIERTKNMLDEKKYKEFSILGIALDSGFNSKTSFNRIFKSVTGMTPTEYIDSVDNKWA